MIDGWDRIVCPAIPGHEWAGTVDAVGPGGDASLVGRRCVAENVLSDGGEVGFEHPGGYAEYLLTEPRNLHFLPDGFPLAKAALVEPLAVCVRGIARLRLERCEPVLILGDGPVGLLMLALLKAEGVGNVVMVGGRAKRLELAKEFGATAVLNYHDAGDNLASAVKSLPGAPFANVIEASGSAAAMATSLDAAAVRGKILVIGEYGEGRADFPWNRVLLNELELIGSNASAGGWAQAVQLAVTGKIPLERLISRRMPATDGVEALQLVRESRDIVKVVLEWPA
jgi:2-desacetyl-2-hydroxyethyl bacteriochlorophyllide A dehydrogenase